ncbi:MAG: hypothetical protein R2731_05520 [Nocardioides sp.]
MPVPLDLEIYPGPALLSGIDSGPSLAAHRAQYGDVPHLGVDELIDATERLRARGRGGAGVPVRDQAPGRRPRAGGR